MPQGARRPHFVVVMRSVHRRSRLSSQARTTLSFCNMRTSSHRHAPPSCRWPRVRQRFAPLIMWFPWQHDPRRFGASLSFRIMNTESWCTVECNSNQQWTRAERKHFQDAFRSSVFECCSPATRPQQGRLDWSTAHKPDDRKLPKKRPFPQKCKLPTGDSNYTIIHHVLIHTQIKQH